MPFDGTTLNETAASLMKMKQYIEEHGWCQGRQEDYLGRVCLLGAMLKVVPRENTNNIQWAIQEEVHSTIVSWNDQQRKVEDVLSMLDRCIAKSM